MTDKPDNELTKLQEHERGAVVHKRADALLVVNGLRKYRALCNDILFWLHNEQLPDLKQIAQTIHRIENRDDFGEEVPPCPSRASRAHKS